MPRIIAGQSKGTRLRAPAGDRTRPTADKVKEALFSILAPRLVDSRFLDLYAGSGQMGLEAVSRGARNAVLVEQARAGLLCIHENIKKTNLTDQVRVLQGAVKTSIQRLQEEESRFDLIFLDPPWQQAEHDFMELAEPLSRLLAQGGLIILEHDAKHKLPELVTKLKCDRRCQYGSAMLSFYSEVIAENSADGFSASDH